jgi:type I restriction enzyme S subunit
MSWKEVEIGNLVELRQGLCINKKSNHLVAETGLPLLRITDMINNKHSVFIKEEVPERYITKYEDIIYSRTGQVGLVFRHQFGVFFNNCFTVTPISDELSRDYLYWFLRCDDTKKMANDYASGAAQLDLSHSAFKCIKIKYPTELPTQRKIASILSAYDDLIENNLKRIKLLEEKAFLRYKSIVREEKLEKYILSDFGDIVTGKTPSTTIADYFGDDVPFIKTPDMHNQIFIEYTDQMLSELGAKSQEKKFLPPLSLCVSCIGTAGVVGITSRPSQTNQQINSIVFNEPKNVYFFYALMSQMKEQLEALGSNGSTFTNVNKNKFENMEVFIPIQKVLNEFAEEFEAPFNLILTLQKQNTKLREARDILLPKLMSGQIEV